MKNLAENIRQGEECKLNLESTSQELVKCQDDVISSAPQPWQKPGFVIGGFSVIFTVGTIFGLTKCFGLCR